MLTRREFSKFFLVGGTASLASINLPPASIPQVSSDRSSTQDCDLLIKGGTVVDPGQHLHAALDVAVKDGKILEVSRDFPESRALKVVSAKDKIVTPGFIDLHVHCFDGFWPGINADHYCLGRGVTTVVDAGSAGYLGIGGFVKYVVNPSVVRIRSLVNIAALGLMPGTVANVMDNPDWVYPQLTAKAAEENKPAVVGIKVRLGIEIEGARDLECLKRALEAAEVSRLPLMAHIDGPYSPLPEILKLLRKGDVFTHIYNNHPHGILDADGKILPEVLEARERGVLLDPASSYFGKPHFSFVTAEKCLQQDFLPDTISTDLNRTNVDAGVFDLPTMVSKFMAIGMNLDKAIERVTVKPAQVFDYGVQLGTLRPGNVADIGIFELQEGKFEFVDNDTDREKRVGRQRLVNKVAVCRGQLFENAA
jgi:dihydroorotase